MQTSDDTLLTDLPPLFSASAHGADTRETRRLSRGAARGTLVLVHPGVYARASDWDELASHDRHRLRLRAAMPSVADGLVVSHRSALAPHGLPTLGGWPRRVHVTDPTRPNGHTERFVVRHGGPLPPEHVEVVDGLVVTTAARTVVDVARTASFASAVVSVDAALRRPGVDAASLTRILASQQRRHGSAAARRVLDFASARSDSPGESWCRCRLRELGAPSPVLQKVFEHHGEEIGPVDFWFERHGVVVEFDGDIKYLDPEYRGGLSADQVMLKERRRERRLLALPEVRDVVRVDWRDLVQPWRLRRLLVDAAVPVK